MPTLPTVFTIVVLTMNRVPSLQRLLMSLEATDFGGHKVALEIHVDKAKTPAINAPVIELATSFAFTHGTKTVRVAPENNGLARSWFKAWYPKSDDDYGIILEDDIQVSPSWYKYVRAAWEAYGDRDDVGGVTLQRQTLIPKLPSHTKEIVNSHAPFLYRLVGSIGYAPHPRQWRKFVDWTRSIDLDTFDVSTPGLVTSQWWNAIDKRHIWTQHFIYFTQKHDLYTLYVNLPGTATLAAHMRDKGEHFATALGQDFPVLQTDMPFQFPDHPVKYDWGGAQVPADNKPHKSVAKPEWFKKRLATKTEAGAGANAESPPREENCFAAYQELDSAAKTRLAMPAKSAELVCGLLKHRTRVLEWGTQPSTHFFARFVRRWETITGVAAEFDAAHAQKTPALIAHKADGSAGEGEGDDCSSLPKDMLNVRSDVIVVRSRAPFECVEAALQHKLLSPVGHVVLFYLNREDFNRGRQKLGVLGLLVDTEETSQPGMHMVVMRLQTATATAAVNGPGETLRHAADAKGIVVMTMNVGGGELLTNFVASAPGAVVFTPAGVAKPPGVTHHIPTDLIPAAGGTYGQKSFFLVNAAKPKLILQVLTQGHSVTWSDQDTVFNKHPAFPDNDCDILASQDGGPICPGATDGTCAGFLHFRHNNKTIAFVRQWAAEAQKPSSQNDQCDFQRLVTSSRLAKVCPLSMLQYASGLMWIPSACRIAGAGNPAARQAFSAAGFKGPCMTDAMLKSATIVHANYVIGNPAKIAALKAAHMWKV